MKRLSKTGIEYGDLNWNFYPGCLHKPQGKCLVPHCWAEQMSKRQRQDFHKPHLIPELLLSPLHVKKPATILVDFMGDLGGDWVDPEMQVPSQQSVISPDMLNRKLRDIIFDVVGDCPQHRFLFLSKSPENWKRWGEWPDNAWVGGSVCNQEMLKNAYMAFRDIRAKHKWLSIEPLLESLNEYHYLPGLLETIGISWVAIGGQTRPNIVPKIEWVKEIVEACDRAGVKVWLKDNLIPLFNSYFPTWATARGEYRQETP